MAVEAICWFHPLVWWLGTRLTEERERPCDEEVVQMGGEPLIYSESILKVCEFYLASPVACAAGGKLKNRIEGIMMNRFARNLSLGKKLMLATAAVAAVAGPFAFGIVSARAQTTPKEQVFEVAVLRLEDPHSTVDYNRPDAPHQSNTFPTNRYTRFHTTLQNLIADAYHVAPGRILGAPAWLADQHYDLSAKAEGSTRLTWEQLLPMLQNLLKQRVHLAVHKEKKIVSGYSLVIAKGGSKLKPGTAAPFAVTDRGSQGEFKFRSAPASFLAQMVASAVKQPVVDKTGLTGTYDCELKFTPENAPIDSPNVQYGSIFGALPEQWGLRLVAEKVPVDYIVIDHVDKVPTEN